MSGTVMQRLINCTRSSLPSHVLRWRNSVGLSIAVPIRRQMPSMPCLSQYIRVIASPHTLLRP